MSRKATPATTKRAPRKRAVKPAERPARLVLDSSCWLEVFADTDCADLFMAALDEPEALIVPVLTIYEVTKKLHREVGEEAAVAALSFMQQGTVVPVDLPLALDAAVSGLPWADSLIYATARARGAELWTQDGHFEGLAGVRLFAKPARS